MFLSGVDLEMSKKNTDEISETPEQTEKKPEEKIRKCKTPTCACSHFCPCLVCVFCILIAAVFVIFCICWQMKGGSGASVEYTVHIYGDASSSDAANPDQTIPEGTYHIAVSVSDCAWARIVSATAFGITLVVCATVILCCVLRHACRPKESSDNSAILLEAYKEIFGKSGEEYTRRQNGENGKG